MRELPNIEHLRECFVVVGGILHWRVRPAHHFPTIGQWKSVNSRHAGKRAGRRMQRGDYRQVVIDGVQFMEHRVIAALAGLSLEGLIDHRDTAPSNNDPRNLRPATHAQNSANQAIRAGKRFKGVTLHKKSGKFQVQCQHVYVGLFSTEEAAARAYDDEAVRRYGEFARLNFSRRTA